jgi:hypothetical protein
MTEGRHSTPRHAAVKGQATAKGGARRAPGGARKATATVTAKTTPKAAPKTAPVAGRRIAHKPSAVAVIRAGSVGTLTAVAPLAVLSVACVVGLGANPGAPAAAKDGTRPQPLVPAGSTFAVAHRAKHRASTPDRVQTAASTAPSTTSSTGVVVPPQAGQVPVSEPTSTPTAAPSASPSVAPTPSSPVPSLPVSVPTSTSTPAPLTEAEATAQCLADGVSALDVVALATCVTDLLTP